MFTEPQKKSKVYAQFPWGKLASKGECCGVEGHSYFFQLGLYVTANSRKVEIREFMGSLLGVRDWDA